MAYAISTLSTQTAYINVIIKLGKYEDHKISSLAERLKAFCDNNMKLYAFILHDRDMKEDNTPKYKHIHMCGIWCNAKQRLSTIMNALSSWLEIDTLEIEIEKMTSLVGSIQYLIHKNDSQKTQYDITKVVSSLSLEELNVYMQACEKEQLTAVALIDMCKHETSLLEIMKKIGLEAYRQYRNVIQDIRFELFEKDSFFPSDMFADKH